MKLNEALAEIANLNQEIIKDYKLCEFYEEQSKTISSARYGEEKIDKTPSFKAPFEQRALKKIDKTHEIEKKEKRLSELKEKVVTILEKLNNLDLMLVIIYRNLSFMKYEDIMSKMHLSRSSVYRLHNEAMEKIKEIEIIEN